MFPRIETPLGDLYTYTLMASVGILLFFLILHRELRFYPQRDCVESVMFPCIVFTAVVSLLAAAVFDALFKYLEYGVFALSGATFYGGLLGGIACMLLFAKKFSAKIGLSVREWFGLLALPLIALHACGRLGCFFAGCCYGCQTESSLGIVFPDNAEAGIYHYGVACFPTQLFEVLALLILAAIVAVRDKRFETYLLGYAIARFFIEFLRGDDRGLLLSPLSPAQTISLLIVVFFALLYLYRFLLCKSK